MNLTLGNLTTLKRHLLGPSQSQQSTFDNTLAVIGRGVAWSLEKFCNRKFERVVGEYFSTHACVDHIIVERYPLETVSAIELRSTYAGAWQTLTPADYIERIDERAGLVQFGAPLGAHTETLRLTYTGGYWIDSSEDDTGVQPAGSTAVPADLLLAWLTQCQEIWSRRDNLGLAVAGNSGVPKVRDIELVPEVSRLATQYKRMAIT